MSAIGFAVAGGASRRMGRDKALLPWDEGDLLAHALARLGRVAAEVRVLGGAAGRYADRGVPVEVDPRPGLGPIGGLLAALEAARGHTALLLAVDLPLVPDALLAALVRLARSADAVVPVSPSGPEPLCAAYGPGCLEAVRRRVGLGELRMTSFWPDVRLRTLEDDALAAFGEADRLFLNLNAPGDYERARALAAARTGAERRSRSRKD